MLFRKFSRVETFLVKEGGNKKPHSLGSGESLKTHHLLRPEEIMKIMFSKVFWLPDRPNSCAFPQIQMQWLVQVSSPVTAAGPQRFLTVFPFTEQKFN